MGTEGNSAARKDDPPKQSIWAELRGAGLVIVGTLAVSLFLVYSLVLHLSGRELSELGEIGDSFGALTSLFNALAFAALIATVVLQSRELRESRIELAKQAKAQGAWAEAAARQIELTKQLEAIRIRPFIKAEWHPDETETDTFHFRVRNVGLGVAIIRSIELRVGEASFGLLSAHGVREAMITWDQCVAHAMDEAGGVSIVTLSQFNDLNRALAPGEPQVFASVMIRAVDETSRARKYWSLRQNFAPVIYFQSMDGENLDTLTQFDSL